MRPLRARTSAVAPQLEPVLERVVVEAVARASGYGPVHVAPSTDCRATARLWSASTGRAPTTVNPVVVATTALMSSPLGSAPTGTIRQWMPSADLATRVGHVGEAATRPAGPAARSGGPFHVAGRPRSGPVLGVHDRPSGEVHDMSGNAEL